ncbi:hypothetical protein BGZ93_009907 [Podila epicladia]|nr:hypothetical protein BGZ93_009907 [Podila epicladia]
MVLAIKRYHNTEDRSRSSLIRSGAITIGLFLACFAGLMGVTALGALWETRRTKKREEARNREESVRRGVIVVLRDASEQQVDVDEIQVGDILMLLPDGYVPVDGIVLKSHGLACDQPGAISEPEIKPTRDLHEGSHLVSGTTVLSGSGSMLVTAVGGNLLANKARDSEDGRSPRERMIVLHAPRMCVATIIGLLVVSFSRYFIMSISSGPLPPVRDILTDLSKIVVQISGIIMDSSIDSLLLCGLCLAAYVLVQLRRKKSMTEMLFKEHRRLQAIGVALLCLAVSKNMFETSVATIFLKELTDSTTLVYNRAELRKLTSYATGVLFFSL